MTPAQDADCGLATPHTGRVFHGCHTPSATLLQQGALSKVLAQNEKQSIMKTQGRWHLILTVDSKGHAKATENSTCAVEMGPPKHTRCRWKCRTVGPPGECYRSITAAAHPAQGLPRRRGRAGWMLVAALSVSAPKGRGCGEWMSGLPTAGRVTRLGGGKERALTPVALCRVLKTIC